MSGIMDLDKLLGTMSPELMSGEFVFCVVTDLKREALLALDAEAVIREEEGLTLILNKSVADEESLPYDGIYRKITLQVHSSLEAVGLTAAFSTALANGGISANVVAGFYHDHIFVSSENADRALAILLRLGRN